MRLKNVTEDTVRATTTAVERPSGQADPFDRVHTGTGAWRFRYRHAHRAGREVQREYAVRPMAAPQMSDAVSNDRSSSGLTSEAP
jgi:hypothetical protein